MLDKVDALAKSGELQAWAQSIAKEVKQFVSVLWQAGTALFGVGKQVFSAIRWLADFVGGWHNLIYVTLAYGVLLKGVGIVRFAAGLVSITKALGLAKIAMVAFNLVMSVNPVVAIATAIVALGAGIVVAYKKFKPFRDLVDSLWQKIRGLLSSVRNSWLGKTMGIAEDQPTIAQPRTLPSIHTAADRGAMDMDVQVHDNRTEVSIFVINSTSIPILGTIFGKQPTPAHL